MAHLSSCLTLNVQLHATLSRKSRRGDAFLAAARPVSRLCSSSRRSAPILVTSASAASPSELQLLVSEGKKVTKSALAKLPVATLRAECEVLGLDAEGTKPLLVERLLEWATETAYGQASTSTPSEPPSSAAPASPPPQQTTPQKQQPTPSETVSIQNSTPPAKVPHEDSSSSAAASLSDAVTPRQIKVTWLGTSSGAPTSRRNVSCIAVRYGSDRIFLVDSGEGTRNQMRHADIDPALVTHIFITHLHGDHCFGIAGTLSAIAAARAGTPRENEPIELFGPPELHRLMLAAVRGAQMPLHTPVIVRGWALDPEKTAAPTAAPGVAGGSLLLGMQPPDQAKSIPRHVAQEWQAAYDGGSDQVVRPGATWSTRLPGNIRVTAAQLQHRMPCWGYVFQEPDEPVAGGMIRPGRKMVILGDTCDSTAIAAVAEGCDVMSHEATYSQGMEEKARIATHSTAEQAGKFARQVRARALVLTHFSARYEQIDKFHKKWTTAKEKGVTLGELTASVGTGLMEEARAVSGGARVYLAQDFYTFTVAPREPVTEEELKEQVERRAQRAFAASSASPRPYQSQAQRRGPPGGARQQQEQGRRY